MHISPGARMLIPLIAFGWIASAMAAPAAGGGGKSAMAAAQGKLGALEPWQKRLFEEEVVPQSQRFLKNPEAAAGSSGVAAEVDLGAVQEYLKFHDTRLGATGPKHRTVAAVLVASTTCAECKEALPKLKAMMATRLDRRGYAVTWVEAGDLASGAVHGSTQGGALSGPLAQLAESPKAKGAAGVWWVDIKPVPIEELDAGHADEKIIRLSSRLAIFRPGRGSYSSVLKPLLQHEGRVELRDGDSPDVALGRIATDTFAEFGAQLDTALASAGGAHATEASAANVDAHERLVSASGFKDFMEFQRLRTALESKLGSPVELRTLAHGRAEFAVQGSTADSAIRNSLSTVLEGESLDDVRLELKP